MSMQLLPVMILVHYQRITLCRIELTMFKLLTQNYNRVDMGVSGLGNRLITYLPYA